MQNVKETVKSLVHNILNGDSDKAKKNLQRVIDTKIKERIARETKKNLFN